LAVANEHGVNIGVLLIAGTKGPNVVGKTTESANEPTDYANPGFA